MDLYTAAKPRSPLSASLSTQLPLRCRKVETTNAESIQRFPAQTAPRPGEEQLDDPKDDPIYLLAASNDVDIQPSNQQRWTRSSIHIFKELKSRSFRICSQSEYLGRETIGTAPFPYEMHF